MLYALAHPASLLVLLVSFVLAVTLHGWVACLVADRTGDRRPRQEGRLKPEPQRHLDPFGAVAAGISGLGWSRPVELVARRRRGQAVAVALSGPAVNIGLGIGLLLAWRFAFGPLGAPAGGVLALVVDQAGAGYFLQHGFPLGDTLAASALLLAGCSQLYLGVLSLFPLPPLDGGRLLFALAPRSPGWQKAEHYLIEQNIGIAVLLALLLLPLGGSVPLLPHLLDSVLQPLVRVICGG